MSYKTLNRSLMTDHLRSWVDTKDRFDESDVIFVRVGDFYEAYGDDARLVAKVLGLVLTSKFSGDMDRIPLVGVPVHSMQRNGNEMLASGLIVRLFDRFPPSHPTM